MRLFLGFEPAAAERSIYALCEKLVAESIIPADLSLRWVPAQNWHVTLVFLGEVAGKMLAQLEEAVAPVVAEHRAMQLSLTSLEWFPSASKARMLALCDDTPRALSTNPPRAREGTPRGLSINPPRAREPFHDFQREVVANLRREGFHTERRAFRPHLTLARVKGKRSEFTPSPLPSVDPFKLELSELILFESVVGKGAPVYEPLQRFELQP